MLAIKTDDGKVSAMDVRRLCESHYSDETHEHQVQPGMVYISFPTENGLVYTQKEMEELYGVCREYKLPLFVDGARLGYGLVCEGSDMDLIKLAKNCDIFYIGGTKVGALFGEAVVIVNPDLQKDFRYMIKQRGGLLAKGRLLGIQFDVLMQDDLYFRISRHAVEQAMKIKRAFTRWGYRLFCDSPTNQQFVILPDHVLKKLSGYVFSYWQRVDKNNSAVRICTSWATREEDVDLLIGDLEKLA